MKLTVYDKSNSHPALTYKGKRIITVCRDGSMYLSRILSRELSLHAGNRLCIAKDEDRPKDWYMFVSDDENGFTIWNDPRCGKGREMRRLHGGERAGECGRQAVLPDNTRQPDTERGKCKDHRYEISPTHERKSKGHPEEGRTTDLRVSLFSCGRRQKERDGFSFS